MFPDGFGVGSISLHNNQKQQQQPKEEKHVESKSYLDSDISSIFGNCKSYIVHHLQLVLTLTDCYI